MAKIGICGERSTPSVPLVVRDRSRRLAATVQNCRINKDVVTGSRDIGFLQNMGRKRSDRLPNETEAIRTNAYQNGGSGEKLLA